MMLGKRKEMTGLERGQAASVTTGGTWKGLSHKKQKSGREHSGLRKGPLKTRWGAWVVEGVTSQIKEGLRGQRRVQ